MKKLLFLTVLCMLAGIFGQVSAQDAKSVMERHKTAMGFSEVFFDKNSSMKMKMKMSSVDKDIPCTYIMAPGHRFRVEMTLDSLNILAIVSGDKGWISIPGTGVRPIPQEQFFQMVKRYNPLACMYWDNTIFDFELLPPANENGKKYDVVRAILKKANPLVKYQDIYFDSATGLAEFSDVIADNGETRILFGEYKSSGKLKYPTLFESSRDGNVFFRLTIDSLETNYPITDEMFAEPK